MARWTSKIVDLDLDDTMNLCSCPTQRRMAGTSRAHSAQVKACTIQQLATVYDLQSDKIIDRLQ